MKNKKFRWNDKLYRDIENKLQNNIMVLEGRKEILITDEKYKPYIREVEEEFLTHVDGPYKGSKLELKNDKEYTNKPLIKNVQRVMFFGDAINKAIEDASKVNGTVVIPGSRNLRKPNIYYSGAILLKSNVELHVEEGAIVRFMRNKTNEYYPVVYSRWEGVEFMNFSPFVYAYEEENIAITGKGTLDGNADEFNWMPWKFGYFKEENQQIQRERLFKFGQENIDVRTKRIFNDDISTFRPPFIQPYKCKNVLLKDIKIMNSPFWEVNPVLCENLKVDGIRIDTNLYNNDGVNPESCKDMIIENSYFLTGDDCIAIKSGRNNEGRNIGVPTENIIIRNNKFKDGHGGITIGSEISGGVHDIYAHDNYFDSKNLDYPIRFKTNAERGGKLENIYVKNSIVNKCKVAVIYVDFFYEEGIKGNYKPLLRNVTLSNIKTVDGGSIDSKNSLYLRGFESAPIENIALEDVVLTGVKEKAILQNVNNITFSNVYVNGKKIENKTVDVDNNGKEIILG